MPDTYRMRAVALVAAHASPRPDLSRDVKLEKMTARYRQIMAPPAQKCQNGTANRSVLKVVNGKALDWHCQ